MNKYDSGVENVFITLADHDGLFEAGESLSGKEMFKYISDYLEKICTISIIHILQVMKTKGLLFERPNKDRCGGKVHLPLWRSEA